MKAFSYLQHTILLLFFTFLYSNTLFAQTLTEKLQHISAISHVKKLASKDGLEKLVCMIEQEVDWESSTAGKFNQRVIFKHRGFDKPTVLVTEGYSANNALRPTYKEELSTLLDANLVFVEHRYFKESTPSPCNWDYLTVKNSVGDYHHIRQLLNDIYPGKWFTTGISKGGQTTLFYRTFYPNDVDGSVAYVAPLNKSIEDGRHQPFIKQIKHKEIHQAVREFQREVLKRRSNLQPMFETYCTNKKYTFRAPISEIFDLTVLEYEFSFWQWGYDVKEIPGANASNETLFHYLIDVCEPSYFSQQNSSMTFNIQALRELGYYDYDIEPLKDLLTIQHAEGYLRRIMVPEELSYYEFDATLYEKVNEFLAKADCPMLFIYGENDPWSASGVTWLKGKKHMHVFIDPEGSHRARIGTMPEKTQKEIKKILRKWLKR